MRRHACDSCVTSLSTVRVTFGDGDTFKVCPACFNDLHARRNHTAFVFERIEQ